MIFPVLNCNSERRTEMQNTSFYELQTYPRMNVHPGSLTRITLCFALTATTERITKEKPISLIGMWLRILAFMILRGLQKYPAQCSLSCAGTELACYEP